MASRYLLIEFDSEESANTLRAKIEDASRRGKGYRVVGLFAKPAAPYCACDPRKMVTSGVHQARVKRGKKFGWWVCLDCKRPTSSLSGLINILKPRDIIANLVWKTSMDHRGGPGFEAQHYISSLSGEVLGPGSLAFWNNR